MAKVKIEKTSKGFIITYNCICGAPIRLITDKKPRRLAVCWDCAFSDIEMLKEILRP